MIFKKLSEGGQAPKMKLPIKFDSKGRLCIPNIIRKVCELEKDSIITIEVEEETKKIIIRKEEK